MQRNDLIEQYVQVSQAMHQALKNHFMKLFGGDALSPAQIGLLVAIKGKQPVSGSDLAAELRISRSAVTQLIDALDQLGYIKRKEDVHDRRISYITLSALGAAKYTAIEKMRRQLYMKLAEPLDDDELRTIVSIHKKMINGLEAS